MSKNRKKQQVCTSLDRRVVNRLDEMSEKTGIKKNSIIEQGIRIRLEQLETQEKTECS